MYFIKNKILIIVGLMLTMVFSCKDLDELNINPNGPDPEATDPYLLMATVLSGASTSVVNLGYGDLAGVMTGLHPVRDGMGIIGFWATTKICIQNLKNWVMNLQWEWVWS